MVNGIVLLNVERDKVNYAGYWEALLIPHHEL